MSRELSPILALAPMSVLAGTLSERPQGGDPEEVERAPEILLRNWDYRGDEASGDKCPVNATCGH